MADTTLVNRALQYADKISKHTDVFLAVAIMGILVVMLIPIPVILLDILLTLSISSSIVILLVSIYAEKPLDFSSFPFVLLLTTLFRLSLNVSTTRTILLNGSNGTDAAGAVIQAFGEFVVGGNYAVGIVVFIILIIINFMVITKGSGRVAEVAARFTLDAMPGKQMAIDADLNAGVIDENEAKIRRDTIRREADFYGSMDGASKFVRGDAVAGFIITAINISAGLIIGVVQNGMSFSDAASVFTILTIGDGLVSQIPALIISTSAGIVVTRAGNDSGSLAKQLTKQLFPQAKILLILGGILIFFALIPGMPKLSFATLGLLSLLVGYLMHKKYKGGIIEKEEEVKDVKPPTDEEIAKSYLEVDIMELEVGIDLIPLVVEDKGGTLLEKIKAVRKQIAQEMGFIVPPIRIKDDVTLSDPREYVISINGAKVAGGVVIPEKFLAMNPSGNLDEIEGIEVKEPALGLPAKWVDEIEKEKALMNDYVVVDPSTVMSAHLTEIIKKSATELIGRQEVQELLERLKEKHPKIVEDLVPAILDLSIVTRVLQNLLRERVSIRNLQLILEALANFGAGNKDIEYLTEKARYATRKQICSSLLASDGKLYVFIIPQAIEELLMKSMHQTDEGKEIVVDPQVARKILNAITSKVAEITMKGIPPVLFVSQPIRYAMRKFVEKYTPTLSVITYSEVSDSVQIDTLGTLEIKDDEKINKTQ